MMRRRAMAALVVGFALLGGQARAQPPHPGYSAAHLYNLANSYARAGKPGMAVLYYERARLLAPGDADIEANLRIVRHSAHLPEESRSRFARAVMLLHPSALAWLGLAGLTMLGAVVLFRPRLRRHRWTLRAASGVGVALVGLTVCNGALLWPTLHQSVIIAAATQARVSPVPMADPLFALPEGSIVTTSGEHEGFVLVHTAEGRSGWVSNAEVAPIVPRP